MNWDSKRAGQVVGFVAVEWIVLLINFDFSSDASLCHPLFKSIEEGKGFLLICMIQWIVIISLRCNKSQEKRDQKR